MSRYARQMQVPGVGADGQRSITAAHVLIVGAGGLGCTVIPALAAAGVGG
jgi:Dinucleotide-utilizing enzymes involved in molybdopterin and thiamine biosynthesis family 2